VPDLLRFVLIYIVKKPFAPPEFGWRKITTNCLISNYELTLFFIEKSDEVRKKSGLSVVYIFEKVSLAWDCLHGVAFSDYTLDVVIPPVPISFVRFAHCGNRYWGLSRGQPSAEDFCISLS
jgi:hypothetical protein